MASMHIDLNGDSDDKHNFLIGLPVELTSISPQRGILSNNASNTENAESFSPSNEGRNFAPGLTSTGDWSNAEKASFLLGLYIFRKNFVEVRKFIETKKMGEILYYYYGEFYGSKDYLRWSSIEKHVYGKKIFSGSMQQELLSRVLPTVSQECRDALLEVSQTFGDEEMSLAEYVSSLKALVGMNVLVEAIGIGKEGRQDLTNMASEPSSRSSNSTIPTKQASSSLTTSEIIKILSGDHRLSKARSNDLFWEAVWPRLLARGWHSEQPTKDRLVFLVPGVEKFSRRELVKGDKYFESITDVLTKVTKEPHLIEHLDIEENDNENENDGLPSKQRHCYLQPSTPNRFLFTVVDTSLPIVRELRGLPNQISTTLTKDSSYEDTPPTTDESLTKSGGEMQDSNLTLNDPSRSGGHKEIETPRILIDLNIPLELEENCESNLPNESAAAIEEEEARSEQPAVVNERRHSTRTRPPTSRALEAIANGYLTVNQRRKSKERNSSLASSSRPLKRALGVTGYSTRIEKEAQANEESVSGH